MIFIIMDFGDFTKIMLRFISVRFFDQSLIFDAKLNINFHMQTFFVFFS